jgi:hypothetical protein
MRSTRARFIVVALLVCFFAIAMATFLNYFKYRSTVAEVVKTRVLYVADGIEDNVSASLALGLPFAEMPTMQALIERERTTDTLIAGIELFDPVGQVVYATDKAKIGKQVATDWLTDAAQQRRDRGRPASWTTTQNEDKVVAVVLKNNFDLTVGYLTVRYPQQYVEAASKNMGWELIKIASAVFLVCAILSVLLLTLIIRRFERDMDSLAETLQEAGAPIVVDASAELPDGIGESLEAYNLQVQAAQNQINVARKHLRAAMALPPDAAADVGAESAFEATEKLTPVGTAPTQPQPQPKT